VVQGAKFGKSRIFEPLSTAVPFYQTRLQATIKTGPLKIYVPLMRMFCAEMVTEITFNVSNLPFNVLLRQHQP